jgi:hypothetical protein
MQAPFCHKYNEHKTILYANTMDGLDINAQQAK